MEFVTLGMFVIDDIYPPPSVQSEGPWLSIPGGAGTYSAIGARVLSPPPLSSRVGWIVDQGTDFPPKLLRTIESWQTGVLIRRRDGLTTQGWNGYSENEHRDFKFLTPKLRLTSDDLSPDLLAAKSFHMVCTQERCLDVVHGIIARRKSLYPELGLPIFIYEPTPDYAIETQLDNTFKAIQHIDVISPNHSELANLFGRKAEVHQNGFAASVVEDCAAKLLDVATASQRHLTVVVRAGKEGCYVVSNGQPRISKWIPAVHHLDQSKVVDPTGGGNGFLGGFGVGLIRTGDAIEAAKWGSVSASLCIEQVGIPVLESHSAVREMWNGIDVMQRLEEFNLCIPG
ncbi:hypothetical protein ANO11243_024130 [Dothideomycetidae sp. 11243]|nr:hypothetical protein ANO11243_024130 [fungal sp. No.11243]